MKISVIIPTYNEEKVIKECLRSLFKQSSIDFEVIIVDDGSNDCTKEELRIAIQTYKNIKLLSQHHQGPATARNLGASQSKGEVLVFVDADMTFEKNFLKMLTRPIFAHKSKGTFSKNEFVSNWENGWARCWNINQNWPARRRHSKNYQSTQPVFRAILKKEFDKVGGFDIGGYTDDWSLSRKLGYRASEAPNAIFYHKNPESLLEVFSHSKWVGKRDYKLGIVGMIFALLRYSLPFSLLLGLLKAIKYKELRFVVFKIVYDLGATIGILEYKIFKKGSK